MSARRLTLLLIASIGIGPGCAGKLGWLTNPPLNPPGQFVTPKWKRDLKNVEFLQYKPREWAIPALDPSKRVLVVGTSKHELFAFRVVDGGLIWKRDLRSPIKSQALVTKSHVHIGTSGGQMITLDLRTGRALWLHTTQGEILSRPVITDGKLIFLTNNNQLYALDIEKRKLAWVYRRDMPKGFTILGTSTPVVDSGKVYAGFADGVFAAVSVVDGTVIWARHLGSGVSRFKDVDSTAYVDGSTVYVASFGTGVYALNADNGSLLWISRIQNAGSLVGRGDYLYFSTGARTVYCLLKKTGSVVWRTKFSSNPSYNLSDPVLYGSRLFVSTTTGIAVLDRIQGAVLEKVSYVRGVSAGLLIDDGGLYFLSNGGHLWAFGLR